MHSVSASLSLCLSVSRSLCASLSTSLPLPRAYIFDGVFGDAVGGPRAFETNVCDGDGGILEGLVHARNVCCGDDADWVKRVCLDVV